MQVWLAFTMAALAYPRLTAVYERGDDALRHLCRLVVQTLAPEIDVEVEAARLHALLDGLAMHLVARADPAAADTARHILNLT